MTAGGHAVQYISAADMLQGSKVFVPPGWNLLIDIDTPKLAELWIDGGTVTPAQDTAVTISTGMCLSCSW